MFGGKRYLDFIRWREKHIEESQFVLILSFIVGILTSLAAVLLKKVISLIEYLLTSAFSVTQVNFLYFLYPAVGILLSSLFVRYIVRDDIGHGVTKILYSISRKQSRIKPHNMWSSLFSSAITIGFGGSVGPESPIVLTGAAIASNLGRYFKMNQKTLMVLVGCGSAAGISGIFKAPIAGMLFVVEVLMLDMTTASVMPLLISSVTAASMTYFVTGTAPMFHFEMTYPFTLARIPWVLVLGIACGLVSLYFIRGMNTVEGWYKKMNSPFKKIATGSVALSILIFLFPPLYGEGYTSISRLLDGSAATLAQGSLFYAYKDNLWVMIAFVVLIIIFKIVATASTNGAGGVGGAFAPCLFVGAMLGYAVGAIINETGFVYVSESNFALLGMAGVMTAVMHSPLTGVFLIAELTGGYALFLPLMIASGVAYLTIYVFEKHSIYSMRLAQKGELLTHHKDKAVLTLMKLDNVIETDFETLRPEMMLGDIVKVVAKARRNIFPVVTNQGILVGIVLLDDIRNIMFRTELYQRFNVKKLMISPPAKIVESEPMEKVMKKFDDTEAWNLPVIDTEERYLGFVSKSKIFNTYRQVLVHFSDE